MFTILFKFLVRSVLTCAVLGVLFMATMASTPPSRRPYISTLTPSQPATTVTLALRSFESTIDRALGTLTAFFERLWLSQFQADRRPVGMLGTGLRDVALFPAHLQDSDPTHRHRGHTFCSEQPFS